MENSAISEYTQVKVFGKNTTIIGVASSGSAPYKTIQYQYMDYADTNELTRIAEQILRDKAPQGLRYEVEMTIQRAIALSLAPGDKVTVTWPVEAISDTGVIRDINYNGSTVILGIGDREVSAFDLLDDKLRLIQGVTEVGTPMIYSGGWQNIDDGTVAASWVFDVADVTSLSTFVLKLAIDKWKTQAEIDTGNAIVSVGVGHAVNSTGSGSANVSIGSGTANVAAGYLSEITYGGGGGITTSSAAGLPTGSFYTVNGSMVVAANAAGMEFGIAHLHAVIQDTGPAGVRYYEVYVYRSGYGQVSSTQGYYLYCPGDHATSYYDLNAVVLVSGYTSSSQQNFYFYIRAYTRSVNVMVNTQRIESIPRHTHATPDAGHSNHASPDSGHSNHAVTDAGHAQSGSDAGHIHNSTPTQAQLLTYPTSIDVWIYNATYPTGHLITGSPFAGGSKQTVTIGDITALLADGSNEIVVYSDTIGSGWLNATFTSYGEGE
jgi:hypothetical protein